MHIQYVNNKVVNVIRIVVVDKIIGLLYLIKLGWVQRKLNKSCIMTSVNILVN